jgi:Holliday junction resolvase RusA-like endonuclease
MPKYRFKVYMRPVPKQYQRVTQQAGHTWAYTPDNVLKAQHKIKDASEGKGAWFEPHVGVRVDAIFYRLEPDSPKMTRLHNAAAKQGKPILPVIESDIDNYQKTLMDALHDVVYRDDCQVTDIRARKRFIGPGEQERIEFTLEEDNGECGL